MQCRNPWVYTVGFMPASWTGCLSALCVCLVCLLFIRVGSVSSEYLNTEPAGVPLIMDSYSM